MQFYAHLQVWTTKLADITRTYLKKERTVGAEIKADVRKNRICGWEDAVVVHHLKEYGLDDLGSSLKYLLDERHWELESGVVDAPEFNFRGQSERLIQKIQNEGREAEFAELVSSVWDGIRRGATPVRKPRYT